MEKKGVARIFLTIFRPQLGLFICSHPSLLFCLSVVVIMFSTIVVPLLTPGGSVSASPLPCELNTAITCREDVAPPPILPRRHTHPPLGHAHKSGSQRDSRQRRRRRTTSTRSADTMATAAQPTKFQTPLVGGAKGSR